MIGDIFDKWRQFVLAESKHNGKRTHFYAGSPLEPNGHSQKTNRKNKNDKRHKEATFGLTEPFHDDELDLLNTNSLMEDELLEKEKDEKKLCKPVNPYHSKSGAFQGKDEPGSWSVDYGGSGGDTDCERGVLKKPGSNQKKVWTKADDCGRRGPWMCSDPSRKQKPWRTKDELEEAIRIEVESVLQDYSDWVNDQEDLNEDEGDSNRLYQVCRKRFNLLSFRDFVLAQNKMAAASKGDLLKKKK